MENRRIRRRPFWRIGLGVRATLLPFQTDVLDTEDVTGAVAADPHADVADLAVIRFNGDETPRGDALAAGFAVAVQTAEASDPVQGAGGPCHVIGLVQQGGVAFAVHQDLAEIGALGIGVAAGDQIVLDLSHLDRGEIHPQIHFFQGSGDARREADVGDDGLGTSFRQSRTDDPLLFAEGHPRLDELDGVLATDQLIGAVRLPGLQAVHDVVHVDVDGLAVGKAHVQSELRFVIRIGNLLLEGAVGVGDHLAGAHVAAGVRNADAGALVEAAVGLHGTTKHPSVLSGGNVDDFHGLIELLQPRTLLLTTDDGDQFRGQTVHG